MADSASIERVDPRVERVGVERQMLGGGHDREDALIAVVVLEANHVNHSGANLLLQSLELARWERVAGERPQRISAEELAAGVGEMVVEIGELGAGAECF